MAQSSALDAVIDEALGGDFGLPEREQALEEARYAAWQSLRAEAGGDGVGAEAAEQLAAAVDLDEREQAEVLRKTNRVVRRVLRPLGYKLLSLKGLDPATVQPEQAREALLEPLTRQQQAELDAEMQQLFQQVYLPEMAEALADAGLESRDPQEAWEQFGREVTARSQPPREGPQPEVVAHAALAGLLLGVGLCRLVGWLRRRRQRGGSSSGSGQPSEGWASESPSE